MAGCGLSAERIQEVIAFHGHWCPGLAVGIRAGEYALGEFGRSGDEEVVAVVETDMCGVDAIQVLTGCTFGKGNLLHLDYGKLAFSFHSRRDGRGVRLVFDGRRLGVDTPEFAELNRRRGQGGLDQAGEARLAELREERARKVMAAPLEEVFQVRPAGPAPRTARIMASLTCQACGEGVMESRTRRLGGQTLCLPCFEARDRRL